MKIPHRFKSILHEAHLYQKIFFPPIENADGTETYITGTFGYIQSPNHPYLYPDSIIHTWRITVAESSTIQLTVSSINTESGQDLLQV